MDVSMSVIIWLCTISDKQHKDFRMKGECIVEELLWRQEPHVWVFNLLLNQPEKDWYNSHSAMFLIAVA